MSGESKAAASVPIFSLLAYTTIEAVASRWWAVAIAAFLFLALTGTAIFLAWPVADVVERGSKAKQKRMDKLRAKLESHPDIPCPYCGRRNVHLASCPVIS